MARFPKNEIISLVNDKPKYDLGASVGPGLHLGELLADAAIQTELRELPLRYGTAAGDVRVRELVANLHGVRADDVVLTVGGQHTLFMLAFLLCDSGDDAVVTTPLYPPVRSMLQAVDANLRGLTLSFDRGYRVDLDAFRDLLTERTKLVSVATPQNPSGVAIPRDRVAAMLRIMEEYCPDAYLLVDETYREAAYGDASVAPTCVDLSPKIISCASLSKCHGAPGLRMGWAITRDAELREQLVLGKFNTVVSNSTVDEYFALQVLRQRDSILAERRVRLAEGVSTTAAWVDANASFVEWVRPDAGAICCVRLRPAMFDDAAVHRFHQVLAREGVRVASGTWFGEEPRVFRLGFGALTKTDLDAALEHVSLALEKTIRAIA